MLAAQLPRSESPGTGRSSCCCSSQAHPSWRRPGYLLVGAWAGVNMTALWSGKTDLSGLRAWQIVAFLIALGLIVLGVLVYRS